MYCASHNSNLPTIIVAYATFVIKARGTSYMRSTCVKGVLPRSMPDMYGVAVHAYLHMLTWSCINNATASVTPLTVALQNDQCYGS